MITIALSSASHLTQRLECPDVGPVSVLVDRLHSDAKFKQEMKSQFEKLRIMVKTLA